MSALQRDRQDLPQYEDSRGGGVFVLIKDDIIGVSEPSPLSLKQLSKQAMNDASLKVPKIDPFEIIEECVRKCLSGLNPTKLLAPTHYSHGVLKSLLVSWLQ